MNRAGLIQTIRDKLAAGTVQRAYVSQPTVVRGGGGRAVDVTRRCQGCDLLIAMTTDVGIAMRTASGATHWFHVACDEIRKVVRDDVMG